MKREPASLSFASIALALADDYNRIFVIDSHDDSYHEYTPQGRGKDLIHVSSGDNFYSAVPIDAQKYVWPDDREYFVNGLRKDHMLSALDEGRSFSLTYRLTEDGRPHYYFLKTIRSVDQKIVIGVRDIDIQKRRELESEAENRKYSEIVKSLVNQYEVIYHIDLATGRYMEYSFNQHFDFSHPGEDFFEASAANIRSVIHPNDLARVLHATQKENLLRSIRTFGSFILTYRQMFDGKPRYMELVAFLQGSSEESLVIGVRNVDAQKKQEEAGLIYQRIAGALASRYEVIYYISSDTGEYTLYSASEQYEKLGTTKHGKDFFMDAVSDIRVFIHPDDVPVLQERIKRERLLSDLSENGIVSMTYRQLISGRYCYMNMQVVQPKNDEHHIIIGVANIDSAKRIEAAYQDALAMANKDAMTGVKNKRAYVQTEDEIDKRILSGEQQHFAVIVCDLNGLKQVNDTLGHKAGDDYIRSACSMVCDVFSHSPVYRIGGDEFAVILQDRDYNRRDDLIHQLDRTLEAGKQNGIRPLAFGMSEFLCEKDMRVQDVFERADKEMYTNKEECKRKAL